MDSWEILCGGRGPISTMKKNSERAWPLSTPVALDTQPKTTQPKTSIMSAYLFFNQEQRVFICKQHQYAVSTKWIARHFQLEHELEFSVRQEITKFASQFTTAEASEFIYQTEKVVPVPYLSICTGFQCQYYECNKVLGTLQSAQKHCQLEHDWKSKDGEKWVKTRAQTFFQGNNKRYRTLHRWELI